MIWLVVGLAIWCAAHLFKRIAPERRERMGKAGKGLVAAALIVALALMAVGYRMAESVVYWDPGAALVGINNLIVLAAFYLFAASGLRTGVTRIIRHPQLVGFALWALAHIIVNGDLPSLVLFGGLLAWALAEIAVINRAVPEWSTPEPVPARKEVMAAAGATAVFAAAAIVHGWLGYNPFG